MSEEFCYMNENLFKLYNASIESQNLLNESKRILKTENYVLWSLRNPKSLTDIALACIATNFLGFADYFNSNLIPEKYRRKLLKILPTNLPLQLTSKLFPDGIYWKRSCYDTWNPGSFMMQYNGSWKNIYMEKYLQNYLENANPSNVNIKEIEELLKMIKQYVRTLNIEKLLTFDNHEHVETGAQHINLNPIISSLTILENLDIKCTVQNSGLKFSNSLFQLTKTDCVNLGEGLKGTRKLKRLRIRSSYLDEHRLLHILSSFELLPSLTYIDFSSCDISDDCLIGILKPLSSLQSLSELILANNKIGPSGAAGIATALQDFEKLQCLNLRLNFILNIGANNLCEAIARHNIMKKLNLSGCKLSSSSVKSLCFLITRNKNITEIDLSCNDLGESGGAAIAEAMKNNTSLQKLNLKINNISGDQYEMISKRLMCNRKISPINENPI